MRRFVHFAGLAVRRGWAPFGKLGNLAGVSVVGIVLLATRQDALVIVATAFLVLLIAFARGAFRLWDDASIELTRVTSSSRARLDAQIRFGLDLRRRLRDDSGADAATAAHELRAWIVSVNHLVVEVAPHEFQRFNTELQWTPEDPPDEFPSTDFALSFVIDATNSLSGIRERLSREA